MKGYLSISLQPLEPQRIETREGEAKGSGELEKHQQSAESDSHGYDRVSTSHRERNEDVLLLTMAARADTLYVVLVTMCLGHAPRLVTGGWRQVG